MGWLRLVGSLKIYVAFAKKPYKTDDILQKGPVILRSLLMVVLIVVLIVATPYHDCRVYIYILWFTSGFHSVLLWRSDNICHELHYHDCSVSIYILWCISGVPSVFPRRANNACSNAQQYDDCRDYAPPWHSGMSVMNESRQNYARVVSHIWTSQVTSMNVTHIIAMTMLLRDTQAHLPWMVILCHTYEWVYVSLVNEPYRKLTAVCIWKGILYELTHVPYTNGIHICNMARALYMKWNTSKYMNWHTSRYQLPPWRSNAFDMNESFHTHERVTWHICLLWPCSCVYSGMSDMNESCHPFERDTSHIWRSWPCTNMMACTQSYHKWVTSHVQSSHGTYQWVRVHTWMSRVARMNAYRRHT